MARTPTVRQQRLADEIILNASRKKPKNKKELLVSAGYDETTAEATPGDIIQQQGVQNALIERGFNVETAKGVVAEILTDSSKAAKDRLRAASEVFKVTGAYAPEQPPGEGNTYNFFGNEAIQAATDAYERSLKEALASNQPQHGTEG